MLVLEREWEERNKQLYMSKINDDLPPQAHYRRFRSHHGKDVCTSKALMDLLHPYKAKVVTNWARLKENRRENHRELPMETVRQTETSLVHLKAVPMEMRTE